MTSLRKLMLIGTILAATAPALAEDTHHPEAEGDAAAATTAPAEALPGVTGPGMGGAGMMGGMMGAMMGGMMSGMMEGMGPGMMSMMSMMGAMGQMMSPAHIEGRIAFLETEMKITPAQQPLWDAFAEALRADASAMGEMMGGMSGGMPGGTQAGMQGGVQGGPPTLLERLDRQETMLESRLDGLRRLKEALAPLYAALDDTQKRTADTLLMMGPMGPMGPM